jgi:hypothetical protein
MKKITVGTNNPHFQFKIPVVVTRVTDKQFEVQTEHKF